MLCDWRSELFEHLCLEMWWATWILKAYAITSYADFNDRLMTSTKENCLSMPTINHKIVFKPLSKHSLPKVPSSKLISSNTCSSLPNNLELKPN